MAAPAPPPPAQEYAVTFNAMGGIVSTKSKTVTSGSTYGTLPTPTKSGYKFAGWYTAASGGTRVLSSTKVNLTEDQTLYAHWTKNAAAKYTVTFNANGGTLSTKSKIVTNGSTYGTQPTPARSGYTFAGWYTTSASTGGTRILSSTKVNLTKNQTLYARWTKKSSETDSNCVVTFNPNGGSILQRTKTVLRGSRYRDLPTPVRAGYHFLGWFTTASGGTKITADKRVTATGNHTLYAHWSAAAVTVKKTETGSWNVEIPAYYRLPLYASQTTATQSSLYAARTAAYNIRCTKRVELSNGTQRYYAKINGQYRWFQFTCEMDVG